ncbi:MAG: hypothetical protein K4H23_04485 [Mollicutes bacterium PWAP]|nr:hypothetical protein [Mollicutes bacterium PWAP]
MGLIKRTLEENRKIFISGILKNLNEVHFKYGNCSSVKNFINKQFKVNYLYSTDFDKCVEQFYGSTDNKQDIEWKLACILFSYSILKNHIKIHINSSAEYKRYESQVELNTLKILMVNSKENLIKNFPDYDINWDGWDEENVFIDFTPKKTIEENN